MSTILEIASELERSGYALMSEPTELRACCADAYRDWDALFRSPGKFALSGDASVPRGYVPLCLPGGCEMKESFYYHPGMWLPAQVARATHRVASWLLGFTQELAAALASLDSLESQEWVRDAGTGCLRIMRYPAFRGEKDSPLVRNLATTGAERSPRHTDLNSLTVLPSPTAPGLEILTRDGRWQLVDGRPGTLVIHAGQELDRRSGGRFGATVHRVRNPLEPEMDTPRMSMALFVS